MYVCMPVCNYVCMYSFMYVCVYYICIHLCMYVCMCASMSKYVIYLTKCSYKWDMSHIWMIHATHMSESYRTYTQTAICFTLCSVHEYMSQLWMRHVTHVNESCQTYGWVMSHLWMSHATHMNEPYHTYTQIETCLTKQCVAVCCSVLQCDAVCCSVLQCVYAIRDMFDKAVCCSVLQCVAVCCSVLQCVAVCCSVLQCVAVCIRDSGHVWQRCINPSTRSTPRTSHIGIAFCFLMLYKKSLLFDFSKKSHSFCWQLVFTIVGEGRKIGEDFVRLRDRTIHCNEGGGYKFNSSHSHFFRQYRVFLDNTE